MSPSRRPEGRSPGVVIVVDGPAYVGKTTTIAALQRAWPRVRSGPLLDVGLERTLASFGAAADRWRELVRRERVTALRNGEHLRWGPLGRELVVGMHRSAATWARAGFDVVVEHVLLDRPTATDLMVALDGLPLVHIGLTCDPDVLEDREATVDGDAGRALAELRATAHVATRHLVLDTTEMATEELVDAVLDEVERRLRAGLMSGGGAPDGRR